MARLVLILLLFSSVCRGEVLTDYVDSSRGVDSALVAIFLKDGSVSIQSAFLFKDSLLYSETSADVNKYFFLLYSNKAFLGSTKISGVDAFEEVEIADVEEALEISEQELKLAVSQIAEEYPLDEYISLKDDLDAASAQELSLDVPFNWYSSMNSSVLEEVNFEPLQDALTSLVRKYSLNNRELRRRSNATRVTKQGKLALIKKYGHLDTRRLKAELASYGQDSELDF